MKRIACKICGKIINRRSSKQKYCGSQKTKKGCAYVVWEKQFNSAKRRKYMTKYRRERYRNDSNFRLKTLEWVKKYEQHNKNSSNKVS